MKKLYNTRKTPYSPNSDPGYGLRIWKDSLIEESLWVDSHCYDNLQ